MLDMIYMNSNALIFLEWSALTIGTFGTILWALGKNQLIISILWLISAILWIFFSLINEHYGLGVRDAVGVILYIIGIKTYWKTAKMNKK